MIRLEKTSVMNFENSIRGMRNAMNSWDRADSYSTHVENPQTANTGHFQFFLGEEDLKLAKKLAKAGSDHRKYLRQIFVSVDITAPLYWWKEYDTYKVGTVANSCSTMHKIHSKEFERGDFSTDKMTPFALDYLDSLIEGLEDRRIKFIETKDKTYWDDIIQLLPTSYNQLRTCTLNYEVLLKIYFARRDHKLDEWHRFCDWILELPYMTEFVSVFDETLTED